ncbi:MAG: sulfate reduction electron transfer complex DsrMKJOP subunit DsrM [Deltaproteobacteria bacterium]|nr:sulfate reduction electron transfer complex DsrMKJOP subunit DsrM [Deltaproteobacteria bacterium]
MNASFSLFSALIAVIVLVLLAVLGVESIGLKFIFGVIIPYVAGAIFLIGVVWRVIAWARVPVPFRIPTTCGQGRSLPWIKAAYFDNPWTTLGVVGRMVAEVLLFRSLFRNSKAEVREGPRITYASAQWVWLAGILFHYSFLTIVVRHLRFFIEPVPSFVRIISTVDGFFQVLLPTVFLSDLAFMAAVTYLFLRRVVIPQVRYISLPADYFPLFLIIGIGTSGLLMRLLWKVDLNSVKQLTLGWFSLHPSVPDGIGTVFYVHLFLVSVLLAYIPFSKIMHMGGVFLSPTRNLANVNRSERWVNPWNYPVKVHTYEEYENEFRQKMKEAGIPVEKE